MGDNVLKLVFATSNKGKLREAAEILGSGFELVTPEDMGLKEEIAETGNSLRANSLIKAQYVYDRCECDCFADDTGLEVEVLNGAPGVHTARYAGDNHDFKANMKKLLEEMAKYENEASMARSAGIKVSRISRKAQFRSVITLIFGGEKHYFEGVLTGRIALTEVGDGGFGYDPIFVPDEIPNAKGVLVSNIDGLTLSQISEDDKNAISHRGMALRAMAKYLKDK